MNIMGTAAPTILWLLCTWIPRYSTQEKIIATLIIVVSAFFLSSYSKPGHSGLLYRIAKKMSATYSELIVNVVMLIVYLIGAIIIISLKAYISCIIPVLFVFLFTYEVFSGVKEIANSNNQK